MSKIKVQQPVIHLPSFKRWSINRAALVYKLEELGIKPFPEGFALFEWYYFTTLEGWGKVLYDLVFKSDLYSPTMGLAKSLFVLVMPSLLLYPLSTLRANGLRGGEAAATPADKIGYRRPGMPQCF